MITEYINVNDLAFKSEDVLYVPFYGRYGLPKKIVTDNGPSFMSDEYKKFVEANRIKHITSALYHPSTNSLVETAVQTVKRELQCIQCSSTQENLSKVLFTYQITPHLLLVCHPQNF